MTSHQPAKSSFLCFPNHAMNLIDSRDRFRTPPQLPGIEEFIEYFEETWLVGQFPLQQWSVYDNDSFRTNNHLEGWHNRLKRVVGKAHPNMFEFVEVVQKEQTATEVLLAQLEAGARPPRRAKKSMAEIGK